jgi:CheY-like chemotaxis protein
MLARHPVGASVMASNAHASILILEDDDGFRRFLVRALSDAGYTIADTGDASEALRLLHGDVAFDLLIADIKMPGLQPHGVNVGNAALNQPHGPKVVYITGDPGQVPHGFVDLTKTPLLAKPIRIEALLEAVKIALAARG